MQDARYFEQRSLAYATAARETKDAWYAQRFRELASHYASMARGTPPSDRSEPHPAA